jgi:hypothetical protein
MQSHNNRFSLFCARLDIGCVRGAKDRSRKEERIDEEQTMVAQEGGTAGEEKEKFDEQPKLVVVPLLQIDTAEM